MKKSSMFISNINCLYNEVMEAIREKVAKVEDNYIIVPNNYFYQIIYFDRDWNMYQGTLKRVKYQNERLFVYVENNEEWIEYTYIHQSSLVAILAAVEIYSE